MAETFARIGFRPVNSGVEVSFTTGGVLSRSVGIPTDLLIEVDFWINELLATGSVLKSLKQT